MSLAAAMNARLQHPEQAAALRVDPTLSLGAWEAALRWDAPIHFVWRDLIAPMEVAGQEVEAGTHMVLGLAAANRD
ncbi:hypothetical protein [Streptomyces sp. NBC_01445]|uniref:hypothetical protein n=1 Tax=Streptomyces sp. NBC_01445 TaxID=2903869 RepID=UPI002DDC1AC0|nr:hypothetical protein [Streptomyces sp. NBC_01445]WSE11051.1 cytochrome P450 [Streptomyces sp. NBC_01445]